MKKGFTLIELVAVIIVLGLLGLIIYPTVSGVIDTNRQKLHDKQMEELIRHAESYAAYNMDKVRAYDGARNIVTFEDLYNAGIIQSEKVIDPSNDEEMTGCMALTWNGTNQAFDIEYTENCITSLSVSGKITGTTGATVYLAANNQALYETTMDSSGNYSFNGVEPGKYILIASKKFMTKYGEEVEVYQDTTKNMTVQMYFGDTNGDNVVDIVDLSFVEKCIISSTAGNLLAECSDEANDITKMTYDLDGSGTVNASDINEMRGYEEKHWVSQIALSGTANLKGIVEQDGTKAPTITLHNNKNSYTPIIKSDGSYEFYNIPRGIYYLEIKKDNYLDYCKYIYLDKDISGLYTYLYGGDIDYDFNNRVISNDDVIELQGMLAYTPDAVAHSELDLNDDGVIDYKDLAIVQRNIGRKAIYE